MGHGGSFVYDHPTLLCQLRSLLPILGLGCDAYDANRIAREDGVASWNVAGAMVAFLPGGDLLKTGRTTDRVLDAKKAGDVAAKSVTRSFQHPKLAVRVFRTTSTLCTRGRRIPTVSETGRRWTRSGMN